MNHSIALAVLLSLLMLVALPAYPEEPPMVDRNAPKRVLVFSLTKGYYHKSIPVAVETIQRLGRESGAFEAVASDELAQFDRESLFGYDAVVFNMTSGELPFSDEQKQNLLEFVRSGRGFVGVHSAADSCYQWPEYGQMVGAYFDGHPWQWNDTVTIRVEEPQHPVAAPFGEGTFSIQEETYQFKAPYDRSQLRVLMSLDTGKTDMSKKGVHRTDGDFALAWVRPFGQGRVFYTALGHNEHVWNDPRFQQHLLAGIRWTLGQIDAPSEPRPTTRPAQ